MALILLVHLVSPTWLHYVLYVVYYLTCLRFEFFRTRLRHCLRQWGFQQGRLHVHPRSESRLLQRGQNNLRQSMDHDFIAFFCYFVRSYWFIENVETRDIIYLKNLIITLDKLFFLDYRRGSIYNILRKLQILHKKIYIFFHMKNYPNIN